MNNKDRLYNSGRRNMVKKMISLGSAAMCAPFVITPSKGVAQRQKRQRIVVRDSGGIVSKIYQEVFYKPFTQATGIEVIGVVASVEPAAQIQAMVETGVLHWDMAAIGHRSIALLTTDKVYLERHELDRDPVVSAIPPKFISPYGVGTNVYSTVLAYRTDVFKHRPPQTWTDLWDVNRFPGRRGLRKLPFDTIEEALMADGVPTSSIYPCNLEQAFCSLDKIRPHVPIWWTNAPEAEQLLKSGSVDLMPSIVSRAQAAIDAGAPIAISWDQHVYGCDSWAILKGTPNADACRKFIQFTSDPKRQALLASHGAIGVTQPDAFNYIDPERAKLLSTYPENLKKGVFIDASYWLKAQSTVIERFNRWMLS